ncbi:MAG TPA: carbohydrate-binding protein, partial [Prolixibacteraceae bacterium]|nr:carbohydrate-binding protein [Prolixibacteraceae bacterium]
TIITPVISLPGTSGWSNWKTTTVSGVILEKGVSKIRFVFDEGGSNLSYFKFYNPVKTEDIKLTFLNAKTTVEGNAVMVALNKPVTSAISNIGLNDFTLTINGDPVAISNIEGAANNTQALTLTVSEPLYYGGNIKLSYSGNSIQNSGQPLEIFTDKTVTNNLPTRFTVPRRIQSEDYYFNNGLVPENCGDVGGGQDMGYAAPGDYLDYLVHVPESRNYIFNFRVATIRSNNQLVIQAGKENSFTPLDTIMISPTGGWQNWNTVSTTVFLEEGRYTLRMYVKAGEFNTNWFQVAKGPAVGIDALTTTALKIYPNPATESITIQRPESFQGKPVNVKIFNQLGQVVKIGKYTGSAVIQISVSDLKRGVYFIELKDGNKPTLISKLIIN